MGESPYSHKVKTLVSVDFLGRRSEARRTSTGNYLFSLLLLVQAKPTSCMAGDRNRTILTEQKPLTILMTR
jgi:hypothetical protein